MRGHRSHGRELALGFVKASETRVLQQKQLIARMKRNGRSTKQAEEVLRDFEAALLTIRNHLEVMQELMRPSYPEK
jgi:hypothetical protein